MFARTTKTVLACIMLSACATTANDIGHAPAHGLTPVEPTSPLARNTGAGGSQDSAQDRFRFVDQKKDGLQSVLLVPTAVEAVVAVGPLARSRMFVGALFASQRVGGDRIAGVGLVIKAIGGGLGATLSALPSVIAVIDGEVLFRGSVARTGLYSAQRGRWGPEETLMFRVRPETVQAMARGSDVELRLGDSVVFRLDDEQIADLAAFLEQIPEDTQFELTHELMAAPGSRAQ